MYKYCYCFLFKKKYFILGGGREKERERNISVWLPLPYPQLGTWPANQACALDWESNQRPFGSQAGAQSTEPHQLGWFLYFINGCLYHLMPFTFSTSRPMDPSGNHQFVLCICMSISVLFCSVLLDSTYK